MKDNIFYFFLIKKLEMYTLSPKRFAKMSFEDYLEKIYSIQNIILESIFIKATSK